jgi:hypothetical protein
LSGAFDFLDHQFSDRAAAFGDTGAIGAAPE